MRKTETLGLPIYDSPDTDLFKFQDWNEGNQKIDNKIKEFGSSLEQNMKKMQWISVFDYGAKGDGITDDSNAINQAIRQAKDGSTIVLAGYGTKFYISKPILITDKNDITFMGVGNVEIYNPNTTNAIEIKGTTFGSTRRVKVKNIKISGTLENGIADIYINNSFRGFEITDCILASNSKYGVLVDQCIKGDIHHCEISGDKRIAGVKLYGGTATSTTTIRIRDNYIWGNAPTYGGDENLYMTYGVHIDSAQSNSIDNNIFEGIAKYGVYITHNGVGVNNKSLKNKMIKNYYEKMDIGVYIEHGGSNDTIIDDEMTKTNKGIYTNSSETKILYGVPEKIEFGINSFHCSAILPYLLNINSINNLNPSTGNNQAIYGVNKTMNFLDQVAIAGYCRLQFLDTSGNVKGSVTSEGADLNLTSTSGNILINGLSAKINNNVIPVYSRGTTANRPTGTVPNNFIYYDTSINKVIYRNASNNGWIDAMGTTV